MPWSCCHPRMAREVSSVPLSLTSRQGRSRLSTMRSSSRATRVAGVLAPLQVPKMPLAAGWLHEIKYDGYRMHARIDGRHHAANSKRPRLHDRVSRLPQRQATRTMPSQSAAACLSEQLQVRIRHASVAAQRAPAHSEAWPLSPPSTPAKLRRRSERWASSGSYPFGGSLPTACFSERPSLYAPLSA